MDLVGDIKKHNQISEESIGHCPECQAKFPINRRLDLFPLN